MRLIFLVIAPTFLIACAGEGEEPSGEAPIIEGLTVSPDVLAVGESTQINGSLNFEDPDGDVAFVGFELRPEGGLPQSLDNVEVAGAAGITVGAVPFLIIIQAIASGNMELGVRLIDAAGNESNELVADLVAQ